MKFLRTLLSVLMLFIVVVALAVSALMYFMNPNKLKPLIAEEVRKKTGYEVAIDGNFTWSILPRIGIKVGRIRFTSKEQKTPFLDLKGIVFVTEFGQLLLGNQKWSGDIYIDDALLSNIHATRAHIGLNWQDGVLNLAPMTADIYSGRLNGIARGHDLSNVPAFAFDVKLSNIDLHALLLDVNGSEGKLQLNGFGDIQVRATCNGKTRQQILSSLNGASGFIVNNGIISGVDLNYFVKSADALMNKQPLIPLTENFNQTIFNTFKGTMSLKNGIATTNDLTLQSTGLLANGSGRVNLLDQVINMQLRLTPEGDVRTKWLIPVLVTGSLDRPDVRLDLTELNTMLAKQKIEEVKNKVRDEVKKRISGKAGDVLQNLLSR